jgi:hypothetical protein
VGEVSTTPCTPRSRLASFLLFSRNDRPPASEGGAM